MKRRLTTSLLCAALALSGCSAQNGAVTITTAAEAEETSAPEATAAAATEAGTEAADNTVSAETVAADWKPDKPLTMIVAYKEGSSTDAGARLLAHYAEKYTGQKIEIKNIPANSGMTGWETLAGAPADGYTLGFINMPNIFTAMDNGGKFTIQDFTPVCNHLIETSVVVVADSSPYRTIEELIEANRVSAETGTPLRAATNGVQASNDIGAALLSYNSGGWNFKHIAYGSTGDQLKSLLNGECDWSVAKVSDIKPYLDAEAPAPQASFEAVENGTAESAQKADAGSAASAEAKAETEVETEAKAPEKAPDTRLRALAVFATERDASLPDVPTLQELGYPTGWYGSTRAIAAPKNTDPAIVSFYAEAFKAAMEDPECIKAHKEEGLDLSYMDSKALAERIDDRFRFNSTLLPKLFMD